MGMPTKAGRIAMQLQQLTTEEKLVLRLRFALDGSYYHALQDIGDILDGDRSNAEAG